MHQRVETTIASLRSAQDRQLEAEGIPMYLALVSETGVDVARGDARTRAAGADLAQGMDDLRAALVPSSLDGDLGCLISVLQVLGFECFDQGLRS